MTRPVGVLDPAPPEGGAAVLNSVAILAILANACKFAIPCPPGTIPPRGPFCRFRAFFRPKMAPKINMFFTSSWLRSWAGPRRFRSPTWPQVGPIWEPCWSHFGPFLGVVLPSQLKTALRSDFDRFFIDFPPLGGTKNMDAKHLFTLIK